MPLFFFLSGLTLSDKASNEFIIGKINRIGIPFVFWSIISSVIALIPHPYSGPFNSPLWFLQCIFSALIVAHYVNRFLTIVKILFITFTLILLYLTVCKKVIDDFLPFSLLRTLTAYIYTYMGFCCKKILMQTSSVKCKLNLLLSTVVFVCLFIFLYYDGLLQGAFYNLSIYENSITIVFVCSFAGIWMSCYLAKLIKASSWLEYLGQNSLVIMLVHFPIAQCLNVYISQMEIYQNIVWRSLLACSEWIAVLAFSLILVFLVKRYIPYVSGYKSMIKL